MIKTIHVLLLIGILAPAALGQTARSPRASSDNVMIDVSSHLINAAVARGFEDTQRIDDVILGTPVHGTVRTVGRLGAVLVPDANNAVVDVYLRGQAVAETVSVPPEKGLLIYSSTCTPFTVRKRIFINETGVFAFPTQARAVAAAKLRKVTTLDGRTGTLLTELAEGAFDVNKPAVEQAAVQMTESQLIQKTDAGFTPRLASANKAFAKGIQKIQSLGIPLQSFHCSTTAKLLSLGAHIGAARQDMPPATAPVPSLPADLIVRVHETAVNETARAILAGKTFSRDELDALSNAMNAPAAGASLGNQHQQGYWPRELVSVTFADHDPIVAAFADHKITLTIHVKELRTTLRRHPGFTAQTIYRLEGTPGNLTAVRQGPVQILSFNNARIGNQFFGNILQASLNNTFKERLSIPSLQPPAALSQIGTLVPVQADAQHGWLLATWACGPRKS